ncbi:MAG TPA: hypothetical protein VHX39_03590, partial [Acetobacteraceae bacterium]|nr:hypothetical protein [Acetobacteraceae bacterium]
MLCAGYLLTGNACSAAGDPSGSTPAAAIADRATEALLHRIVQQIVGGRIISPPDDNAMQSWQLVLQRDIATHRSPEVLKALEDFDTFARARAADEKTAGHVLVGAELIVFADQASHMMGRTPPIDLSGPAASAPDAAIGGTPPVRSDGGTSASTADATPSITDAVVQAAPRQQALGTTVVAKEVAGSDGRPVGPAGKAGSDPKGLDGAHQAADTASSSASGEPPKAASTDIVQAVQIASNGDVRPASPPAGPTSAATPVAFGDAPEAQSIRTPDGASGAALRSDVPFDKLSGQLRAQPAASAEAGPSGAAVTSTLAAA